MPWLLTAAVAAGTAAVTAAIVVRAAAGLVLQPRLLFIPLLLLLQQGRGQALTAVVNPLLLTDCSCTWWVITSLKQREIKGK